jgi:hypothetical protein
MVLPHLFTVQETASITCCIQGTRRSFNYLTLSSFFAHRTGLHILVTYELEKLEPLSTSLQKYFNFTDLVTDGENLSSCSSLLRREILGFEISTEKENETIITVNVNLKTQTNLKCTNFKEHLASL